MDKWISVYKQEPRPKVPVKVLYRGQEIIAEKWNYDYWQLPGGWTTKEIFFWQPI